MGTIKQDNQTGGLPVPRAAALNAASLAQLELALTPASASADPQPDPTSRQPQLYLKKPQVAAMFQVTIRTLDDWMQRGLIPYIKLGRTVRFRADDIEAYVWHNLHVARRSPGGRHE